jgi:23S rRNA pseudouridine955/2504/2580 synthase
MSTLPIDKSSKAYQIRVSEDYVGQRIDNFLFSRLKGLPKSRLYRAMRHGEIRVNKKRVKPEYRLEENDLIRIPPLRLAAEAVKKAPPTKLLEQIEQSIIYEDKGLIIINKPSGIAAHGGSGINFGVIELLRQLRPRVKYLELAHRLDRETTGCLILCKKPSILKEIHGLLREAKVEKTYLALVHGQWQGKEKRVNAPLLKNLLRSGERVVKVHEEGKPAETLFKPLKIFKDMTLVEAKPKTGRTHQIRVHAAHLGHPIAGDEKYATAEQNKEARKLGVKHLLLHAASLQFQMSTDETIAICACFDRHLSEILQGSKSY